MVGIQLLGIIGALILPPWFAGGAALVEELYLKPKLIAESQMAIAPGETEDLTSQTATS